MVQIFNELKLFNTVFTKLCNIAFYFILLLYFMKLQLIFGTVRTRYLCMLFSRIVAGCWGCGGGII